MCVTGYCSAQQATNVCPSLELQTIAVRLSVILTTATTTASVHTTQANFQFAGENIYTHRGTNSCMLVIYLFVHLRNFCVCKCLFVCITSCLVGEDFWYMGQRCDVRMTRARLVGTCLAILLVMVTVIAVLAFVAVRRYRAILIQAKVDQTRSRYTLLH